MINAVDILAQAIPSYREQLLNLPVKIKNDATDLKLSAGFSPVLFLNREIYRIKDCKPLTAADIQDIFFSMCDFSVYKHLEEIKQGFITYKGRYRVGICGTAVTEGGEITNIKNITSLIVRIPRLIYGAAEDLRQKVNRLTDGILIVGEPASGKTTVLRDLLIVLSEKRLVVLDERRELTGGLKGTELDVLYGYPKNHGINHAIRNLGAEVIMCDELEEGDLSSVKSAASSGVNLIATVHGAKGKTVRSLVLELSRTGAFKYIALMKGRDNPCLIEKVLEADDFVKAYGSNIYNSSGAYDRNCSNI